MGNPKLMLLVGSWHLLQQKMGFGNPTAGGFATMNEALREVAKLMEELNVDIAVSAHWWHELTVPFGYSAQWNNPRGIRLDQWIDGVKAGYYPWIGRIVPPGFGLPGSDDGAFISPNPLRRKLAHDMMVYSFEKSELVKSEEVGAGDTIYWTGPDGIRWKRLVSGDDVYLSHSLNLQLEEWRLIVEGVGGAVKDALKKGYTNTRLLIEGKPAGDPCYMDVFTDTYLEIEGIKAINKIAGADVAEWQGEFCHSRGSGQKFANALQQAIDAGVFGGSIHLNSGGLGFQNFTKMLSRVNGTRMSKFQQYVDNDFLPGEGPKEWLEDQIKTIELGKKWSAENNKPLNIEFDARFCRYHDTIGALKESVLWTIGQFNKA